MGQGNGKLRAPWLVARVLVAPLVILCAVWVYATGPAAFDSESDALGGIAEGLLRGETYPKETLGAALAGSIGVARSGPCQAFQLSNLLLVQMALAELSLSGDDANVADDAFKGVKDLATRVIECNPYSSLAWTALGWEEYVRHDGTPRMIELFDMSYQTGPLEAWPLLRRLGLMLPMVADLDQVHRQKLEKQIGALLRDGLLGIVVSYYVDGGEAQKAFLKEQFERLGASEQTNVVKLARTAGVDIDLPLADRPGEARPWDR